MESATIKAYDSTGDARVPTEVRIGDLIEWKCGGTRGAYKCRVLGFKMLPGKRLRLRVQGISLDGKPVNWQRYITEIGVLRVLPQGRLA